MQAFRRVAVAVFAATAWVRPCQAQFESTVTIHTDPTTNITFNVWTVEEIKDPEGYGQGHYQFGMALPPDALTKDATEYIGFLRCQSVQKNETGGGWCGVSHGQSGQMTNALLLVAYPDEERVMVDLRSTSSWMMPPQYTGNATITPIHSFVNDTMYEVIFRCQNCFQWQSGDVTVNIATKSGLLVLGRAQGVDAPQAPKCPAKVLFTFHDFGYGQYGANIANATQPYYSQWAAMATAAQATDCENVPAYTTKPTPTRAAPTETEEPIPEETALPGFEEPWPSKGPQKLCMPLTVNKTYDYIIVGGGASGLLLADKFTAAGKTVLVLEKGPPSTGRWGGTMKPLWLQDTNMTQFDVPGLANWFVKNSTGYACDDNVQPAACLLGGGTAIGQGLWFKAHPRDWESFPAGWRANDMRAVTDRLFAKIPGVVTPSTDGHLYQPEPFEVIQRGLDQSGYTEVVANDKPELKHKTYSHGSFMGMGGLRSGPLTTYLVSAAARTQLTVWMNSPVRRLVREGGHVTGVELECAGGFTGIINVTNGTGRVILSAGTFGSAKILMRSGIGPADQSEIVEASPVDGDTMIAKEEWIDLPVGYGLVDRVDTQIEFLHPNVTDYDWNGYYKKNDSDPEIHRFLANKTGILTQFAPGVGPVWWEEFKGPDGLMRTVQYTAVAQGSTPNSITLSMKLSRGTQSRGRMTISSRLNSLVSLPPYLHNDLDKAVIVMAFDAIQKTLNLVDDLVWTMPPPYLSPQQFVDSLQNTAKERRSNNWIGTNRMSSEDGRTGGAGVVDANTRVYGTDNLFVVDASVIPSIMTSDPLGVVMAVAERAFDRITAMRMPAPAKSGAQCGGPTFRGPFQCEAGLACNFDTAGKGTCGAPVPKVPRPPRPTTTTDEAPAPTPPPEEPPAATGTDAPPEGAVPESSTSTTPLPPVPATTPPMIIGGAGAGAGATAAPPAPTTAATTAASSSSAKTTTTAAPASSVKPAEYEPEAPES